MARARTSRNSAAGKASLRQAGMRIKIGVMGGAGQKITRAHLTRARDLGKAIARSDCILITGACPGLPLASADGAQSQGGLVIGISPALSLDEHIQKYASPAEGHDVLIYTGSGLMGREVVNIRSSDFVIIVGGRSGTLGELAIAYDEGKLIGVLQGTGGITDLIPEIIAACRKNTGARVLYDAHPPRLVARLIHEYRTRHCKQPSCFSSGILIKARAGTRTARDLVCGMWIDPTKTDEKVRHKGNTYYFCCSQCAVRFRRNPKIYLKASAAMG